MKRTGPDMSGYDKEREREGERGAVSLGWLPVLVGRCAAESHSESGYDNLHTLTHTFDSVEFRYAAATGIQTQHTEKWQVSVDEVQRELLSLSQ